MLAFVLRLSAERKAACVSKAKCVLPRAEKVVGRFRQAALFALISGLCSLDDARGATELHRRCTRDCTAGRRGCGRLGLRDSSGATSPPTTCTTSSPPLMSPPGAAGVPSSSRAWLGLVAHRCPASARRLQQHRQCGLGPGDPSGRRAQRFGSRFDSDHPVSIHIPEPRHGRCADAVPGRLSRASGWPPGRTDSGPDGSRDAAHRAPRSRSRQLRQRALPGRSLVPPMPARRGRSRPR